MKILGLEANSKLLEIESRLHKFAYLSKKALPDSADALVYLRLAKANSISSIIKGCPPRKDTSISTTGIS